MPGFSSPPKKNSWGFFLPSHFQRKSPDHHISFLFFITTFFLLSAYNSAKVSPWLSLGRVIKIKLVYFFSWHKSHYFVYSCLHGSLTQSVEYLPFKQRVVGSSPTRPTSIVFRSPSSSQVQDTGLSRRQQGFKSPWGRQMISKGYGISAVTLSRFS